MSFWNSIFSFDVSCRYKLPLLYDTKFIANYLRIELDLLILYVQGTIDRARVSVFKMKIIEMHLKLTS